MLMSRSYGSLGIFCLRGSRSPVATELTDDDLGRGRRCAAHLPARRALATRYPSSTDARAQLCGSRVRHDRAETRVGVVHLSLLNGAIPLHGIVSEALFRMEPTAVAR